jgi:hypothetical protein
MNMDDWQKQELAAYIAEYISEEIIRGNVEVDSYMVRDAMDAYFGGAADDPRDVIKQPAVVHKI